jgi:predicted phage tail protein
VSYDVELACEKCNSSASWSKSVAKRIDYYTHWVTPALAQDGNYRFRVRGIAQNGWVGPWSTYRYFTVDTRSIVVLPKRAVNNVLAVPEIISPAKEAVFTTNATTVNWSTVAAAARYELQLSCDTCNGSETKWQSAVKQVTTSTSLQLSDLTRHEYRVRVRALDDSGAAGSWSEFRYFSVNQ